ncbi:hypothetical protein ACMFMG_004573 [Clarireedia jacksonii]
MKMAIDNDTLPCASAPPTSPLLAAMSGTGELQEEPSVVTSIPISISKSPSTARNNVMDTKTMFSNEMPLQTIVSTAQIQSTNTLLHSHYGISSCSGKSYIPTSYNSPGCSSERARPRNDQINHHSAIGQSLKDDAKPTISSLLSIKKVHLRGGGPKRRRGGSTGGARKRGKADMYDDINILLSDTKSPIFQEDANIKGILLHPQTKETTIGDEGEIYPFEYMTGEELATTAAAFKEDGAYGRYDIDWLRQALEASALRSAGAFDEHEAEQFTEDWAEEDEEVSDEEGEEATMKENNEEMKEDNEELENIGETAETTSNSMQATVEPAEDVDEPMMDVKEQMNHVDDLMQKADSAPKTVDEGVEKMVEEENQQEEGHGFIR